MMNMRLRQYIGHYGVLQVNSQTNLRPIQHQQIIAIKIGMLQ